MKYFNIKSIVLGIGIGFIIAAISGAISFSFVHIKEPMSKEEIISKAREYGMVEASVINKEDVKTTPTPTLLPETKPTTQQQTPTPIPTTAPTLGPAVTVRVEQGDTAVTVANKLFESKLISDKDGFVSQMIESGVAYRMIAKDYHFNLGMTEKEIMEALTKRGY